MESYKLYELQLTSNYALVLMGVVHAFASCRVDQVMGESWCGLCSLIGIQ
jgi:hypothetical protein